MAVVRQRLLSVSAVLAGALITSCSSDKPGSSGYAGEATVAGRGGTPSGSAGGGADAGGASGTGGSAGATVGGASGGAGAAGVAGLGGGGSGGGSSGGCVLSATDAEQPMLLSQTGCIDMSAPTKPATGLIPYSVRSPLWSDGATKERFVHVPTGMKIHALDCTVDVDACKDPGLGGNGADEGHWDFPVGTVFVKNFSIDSKHIETRLLMRRSNTVWKGFSYEWNDPQTEAELLPDDTLGKDKMVGASQQVWHFPSRSQCLECHTKYSGRSLGPSTAQLNSDFAYADGAMNQVDKFKQLGLFDVPPPAIVGLPDPAGVADPVEARARSYIQTNCAICHRPGGEFSSIDMRFKTPFADTKLCDVIERDTSKGLPKYRVVPGDPAKSTMSARMHALDALRMPKIGSTVLDPAGSQLIDDWITALSPAACPPQPQ